VLPPRTVLARGAWMDGGGERPGSMDIIQLCRIYNLMCINTDPRRARAEIARLRADSRRESCGSPRARRRHVEGRAGCHKNASDLVVEGSRSGSGLSSAPGMSDASDLPPREAHQSYRPRLVCYCSQTVHIRDWFVWGKRRRR
jgi:hypothetical protein